MFMQKINLILFVLLFAFFILTSCEKKGNITLIIPNQEIITEEILIESDYYANITDLNGTWHPDCVYNTSLNMEENAKLFNVQSFSWGEGKFIMHTSNIIDITTDDPFINTGSDGGFYITNITQIKPNSIKVNAYQGRAREPEDRLYLDFVFHFIDYNTLWIEVDYFEGDMIYGKGNLWHRLSGPEKLE